LLKFNTFPGKIHFEHSNSQLCGQVTVPREINRFVFEFLSSFSASFVTLRYMSSSSMSTRSKTAFRAELCLQADRYEEMVKYIKELITDPQELSSDERNLFLIAFKHILSPKQNAWRTFVGLDNPEDANEEELELIREQKKTVENEIEGLCNDVLTMVDDIMLPSSQSAEGKVFFNKMKGDYLRYVLLSFASFFLPLTHSHASVCSVSLFLDSFRTFVPSFSSGISLKFKIVILAEKSLKQKHWNHILLLLPLL
jgi:hypothetical protein